MSRAPVRRTRRRRRPTYAERARLAIAHRFTTIRAADQVVVLDHGQVAAVREHEVRWTPTMTALASPSRQDEGPSCHSHTSSTRHRCSSDLTQNSRLTADDASPTFSLVDDVPHRTG
jgi:hypothetical protein